MQYNDAKHIKVTLDTKLGREDGYLYLPDGVPERPSIEHILDMLNDDRQFIAVGSDKPPFLWLIAKGHMVCLAWTFEDRDSMETHISWDRREQVRIVFQGDKQLQGYLLIVQRQAGYLRVQDYLNRPEQFIAVIDRDAPTIRFVNKDHIERVAHSHH